MKLPTTEVLGYLLAHIATLIVNPDVTHAKLAKSHHSRRSEIPTIDVHLCTVPSVHLQTSEGKARGYGLHDLTQKPGKAFMT